MSSILFQITMGTGLALAIDKNNPGPGGQLILMSANSGDPDQQWTWVFNPATNSSILSNPGRGLFAAPQSIAENSGIFLYKPDTQFKIEQTFVVLGASKSAVQSASNSKLNMNALGKSWPEGTKIGLWDWCGGQDNELWTSTIVDF